MKRTHTVITVALMGLLSISLSGQSGTLNFSEGKQDRMRNGQGHRERPDLTQVVGHLFEFYDLDENGELAGEELIDTTYDIILHRPPPLHEVAGEEVDLVSEAMKLESLLLGIFDSDESGGISPEELMEAMKSMKPPCPPQDRR